jgi:hypothetical protein
LVAVIKGIQDTLDDENAKFEQTSLTQSLFVNSVPKSGTHLLRNILRMFVPARQHYAFDFVQVPNLHIHGRAFDPQRPTLSSGHLIFSEESVAALGSATRHLVLVRDPYDWVLARTRFLLSDEFQQDNLLYLKEGKVGLGELLNLVILGIYQKSPSLMDMYMHNALAWIGTSAKIVRFEDLKEAANDLGSKRSERYFQEIFDHLEREMPEDWRERVRIGADPAQSRTARQNLNVAKAYDIPKALPDAQKLIIDACAPGLRAALGYGKP